MHPFSNVGMVSIFIGCKQENDMKQSNNTEAPKGIKRLLAFIILSSCCLVLSFFTPIGDWFTVDNISHIADTLGFWGPVLIIGIGIFSPLLFIPRWPIAFVSGLLYGVLWGTILATTASTLGAWLHFTLAHSLLSPISQRLKNKSRFSDIRVPHRNQFLALFFLRAFPLSNFVATNLLAGALKMNVLSYIAASFLGMIPSSIMYASWGKLMKKPSGSFYAVAALSLAFIVVGTLVAQRYFYPWIKKISKQ